jgi:hypothetical protein
MDYLLGSTIAQLRRCDDPVVARRTGSDMPRGTIGRPLDIADLWTDVRDCRTRDYHVL